MHLKTRNVNTAFLELVMRFSKPNSTGTPVVRLPSRNGAVLRIAEPVMITYEKPKERVLFNAARDANPFFHLYEALWMLAGRNDVAPLSYYNSKIKDYSDDGQTLNGAYGHRWRKAEVPNENNPHEDMPRTIDQLDIIVNHLKADSNSRRAVLSMWNVENDLLKIGPGPDTSLDVCCNLNVMFELRESDQAANLSSLNISEEEQARRWGKTAYELDMTVTNRSNDLIWGLLGANYVHFGVLQEYLAARLGAEVGLYHHFTNNLHAYVERKDWNPVAWLADEADTVRTTGKAYGDVRLKSVPLVKDPATFERELLKVVEGFKGEVRGPRKELDELTEPFFRTVAGPMLRAYELHKTYREAEQAIRMCDLIAADDWRIVAKNWLKRRVKNGR